MPSKEALATFYLEKNFRTIDLSRKYSVSASTIRRWLRNYNIPRKHTRLAKMKPSRIKKKISANLLWYAAGFFDGEGCICRDIITIAQANKPLLEFLRKSTGVGDIYPASISHKKPEWKDAWVWSIARQNEVLDFLNLLKDKVLLKQKDCIQTIERLEKNRYEKIIPFWETSPMKGFPILENQN